MKRGTSLNAGLHTNANPDPDLVRTGGGRGGGGGESRVLEWCRFAKPCSIPDTNRLWPALEGDPFLLTLCILGGLDLDTMDSIPSIGYRGRVPL